MSLQERSTSEMERSIRSDDDKTEVDAIILAHAERALLIGYVPDWTNRQRAEFVDEFRVALRDLPKWAINHGFREWTRTKPRRPSPAEIRILATRALQPITAELERRRQARAAAEAEATRRPPVSKERAEAIMAEAGFDLERTALVRKFPEAATIEDAEKKRDAPQQHRHWSETATPEQLELLRRSRAENANVQAARAVAEKQAEADQ